MSETRMIRHVGQDHLGNKVVVVFRELPEDKDHCLVVQSSTLPDLYHDNLMNVLESTEAQQTHNFYEVLARRIFGDGQQMLNTLHNRGFLKKMSVDQINLVPMPNRQLPLREANTAIGGGTVQPVAQPESEVSVANQSQGGENLPATTSDAEGIAENLLIEARLLEADAKAKRERAYQLNPALKQGGRPSKEAVAKLEAASSSEESHS